ncbi:N-acetylmuramoyl-L-alanine amidase [Halovulum dunhuangense]|uniref:N-acetylmuramoyl-L-alanine amidase n=1 Tax=Halovulum dunhuangense TaxID=1505036 RepID=A0A849L137_9RHOB|nr:N-acetylmuramoyl-L-alanine amidase [Halovulum dunhuangense]
MVVLHYTAMPTAEDALARLCAPEHQVSAHWLIAEDGRVWRMVPEELRAWHAGAGAWGAVGDVNSHSIGIELANTGAHPFPEPQMRALEALLSGVLARWRIPPERVIGHSDMAPDRKSDPGPRFDWRRLARAGLSVWPGNGAQGGQGPARFMEAARRFGYAFPLEQVLPAFRLRFRPWRLDAPLEAEDIALIEALARRYPCLDPDRANPH